MAFSNAILPTYAPVTPGGGIANAMQGLNQTAASAFAPQQAQANAFLTQQQANYLPFQYTMQALGNPLVWAMAKDNPQLAGVLNNLMKGNGSANSMNGIGGGQSQGFLSLLKQKLLGDGQASNNAMQQTPAAQTTGNAMTQPAGGYPVPASPANMGAEPAPGTPAHAAWVSGQPQAQVNNGGNGFGTSTPASAGSPVVPSTQGSTSGVEASMTAPYTKSPYNGDLIADPNNKGFVLATPNAAMIAASENAMVESKNLQPIIKELNDGAQKWLAPNGAEGNVERGLLVNQFMQKFGDIAHIPSKLLSTMGLTEADLSDYANFKADQSKAVNAVMEARNWPANVVSEAHVADIMTPLPGEGRNYGNRVVHDLAQIDAQVQNYKNALQQGQTTAPLTIQYPNSSQPVPAGTGAAGGVLANQTSNSAAAPANTGINDIPGTGNDSGKTTRNPNITDENIAYTMKANNMTRAQVIAELKRRNMM